MNDFLKSLMSKTPEFMYGASGQYVQLAKVADSEGPSGLYARFKRVRMPALNDGNVQPVDGLQVNLVYVGKQFELPPGFSPMSARKYAATIEHAQKGKATVNGMLVAKWYVPVGEVHQQTLDMYETMFELGHCQLMQERAEPLIKGFDGQVVITFQEALEYYRSLITDEQKFVPAPQVYNHQEWGEYLKAVDSASAKKFSPPAEDPEQSDDPSTDTGE